MKFDVIVAGGGTAGCACAYVSAKLGLKVLLVEKNSFLGGSMTSSLVTPAMKTSENNINSDFYRTLMAELRKIGGQITYSDGNIGWFNPELMKITLDKMMSDVGVQVLFNTKISDIQKTDRFIKRVLLSDYNDTTYSNNKNSANKILSEYIETIYLVDGTGDAKIFEKLNCDFLENFDKNKKSFQPINLRFIMSGINIEKFSNWIMKLDSDRDVTTSTLIDGQIHLSTAYTWDAGRKWALEPVFKAGIEKGLITEEDSNYFQVFSIAGMPSALAFNCPRMITKNDINPEDCVATSEILTTARASIYRLSEFFKVSFEGFEDAYISQIANELGVRVSKRIKGKYVYTIDDLRSGKTFDNPCLISNYPVDIHSSDKNCSVLEKQEQEYMLPIESLQSCRFDNLFAIGRCISADFEAQAALRIIPSCFSMGEGLAKYMAENL